MIQWLMFAVGMLLIIGTGLFVASEFSLVNLDRADLQARQARGETRLGLTIEALKITSTHLSSAQLGITLTTLLTGYTMEPAMTALLIGPLTSWGLAPQVVPTVAVITSIVIATLLSMIIGELIPKNFALALPRQTAKVVMGFQTLFTKIFLYPVKGLNNSANSFIRMLGVEPKEELSGARSAQELNSLLSRSVSEGSLDSDTAGLLSRTLNFNERTAAEVMTPRFKMITIDKAEPASEVIHLSRKTGFSRFPVIDEHSDNVVGIVHIKQAIAVPRQKRANVPVAAVMDEALVVPETMRLDTLLPDLKKRSYQVAIVVDEYGGTAGLATLEDLVEEIVGELLDEHDRHGLAVVQQHESIVFSGLIRPDELEEQTGIRVPEDGAYETVAGFMLSELGDIPEVGDTVPIESGLLRVERMESLRIDRVRYVPAVQEAGQEVADD